MQPPKRVTYMYKISRHVDTLLTRGQAFFFFRVVHDSASRPILAWVKLFTPRGGQSQFSKISNGHFVKCFEITNNI